MAISERLAAGVGARIRALAALGALLAMAAGTGCARTAAAPPEPPSRPRTSPSVGAAVRTPAPSSTRAPAAPDPGEEITPEELSTIPEPVPRTTGGGAGRNLQTPLPMAQAASEPDSAPVEWPVEPQAPPRAPEKSAAAVGAPASVWRVQIFATQDRGLADRMAREAALALQAAAHVEHEGSSYKVRLGDFNSEEEAEPLRERAVRSGYPGAFKIRCAADATHNTN
jgi:hypothetical protein